MPRTLDQLDREVRRLTNSVQRRVPITKHSLPREGAAEGDWWFSHPRGDPLKLSIRESGQVQHFWSGEPLFVDGSNRMRNGTILNAYDLKVSKSLMVTGVVDIIHTATEADDHALELDVNAAGFGDVKALDIDYITGAIDDGQDEGIILINIDESLAEGGDIFALEVLATEGDAGIYGLKAAALVGPIHQDSGVFADMDSALVNAVDRRAEFISSASDIAIFVADNDTVTIGHASVFEEIEFLLATTASVNIKPTFEFSTGVGAWTAFTPVDGTNGMRNTGVIAWDVADIPTWAVGAGAEYLIRITRTKNNLSTVPVEDKVQIAATTTYEWTKDGDVFIRNVGRDADNLLDFATDNEITFRVGAADRGTWTTTGIGFGTASPSFAIIDKSGLEVEAVGDFFPGVRIERSGGSAKTNAAWETFIGSTGSYAIRDVVAGIQPFGIDLGNTGTVVILAGDMLDLSSTARVAGDPTTDGYFVMKLSGVSYKIPCLAV